MSNNWTENQKKAIDARGMQVLVSAAAGSGKTTVLTERVKNMVLDSKNPCDVSQLLVVTFTKAAASEMRDRIYSALKENISLNSENSDYLRKQLIKLPTSDICTIDSFCSKLVKENFSAAGVDVDFRVLDDKELAEITADAIKVVIDKLYDEDSVPFRALTSLFLSERDDKKLGEVIESLYKYSRSYPSPNAWLNFLVESFDEEKTPNDTVWSDIIYKYIGMFADYHEKKLLKCVALMEASGGFSPAYLLRFNSTADNLKALKSACESKNWDGMIQIIDEGVVNAVSARNVKVDVELKELTMAVFDELKTEEKTIKKLNLPTTIEHKMDSAFLSPIVDKLCQAVKMLDIELKIKKAELNAYGFNDILHKCIDLLVEFNGDNWVRTELAKQLQGKYKEILIDEYQDTNEAQNILFEALSSNKENLYCVGDVKQSIYKFRLASPELFMNLKRTLPTYDGGKHPSQITLETNFRSRFDIDEAVNYVFKKLMSLDIGDIDYNNDECLNFGADYYKARSYPSTEILCLDAQSLKTADVLDLEAEEVAKYIKRIIDSKTLITTKTGERPAEPSDFCVLLRNSKNTSQVYAEALKKYNLPYCSSDDGDISESKEIKLLISIIKAINNPLIDIPLIAFMSSAIFGFTPDELSEIRMINRKSEFFPCVEKYAEKSVKAKKFLQKFNLYRNISVSYPVNDFVKFIINDTSISDLYLADVGGEQRKNNIRGFQMLADEFVASGRNGLGSFIRFVDSAVDNKKIKSFGGSGNVTGVQITTIHKSKGLEYPYVILAACSKEFNKTDSHKIVTLARETGIGIKIRDDDKFTQYKSLSASATEKSILFDAASEELRVLYVAMTRAKEHLTFILSVNKKSLAKKVVENAVLLTNKEGKIHPYAVFRATCMSEWLLSAFATHKDCQILRDLCGLNIYDYDGDEFSVDTSFVESDTEENKEDEITEDIDTYSFEPNIVKSIEEKVSYSYAYDCSGVLAKRTASSTENKIQSKEYFAKSKPKFLDDKFTGADRGTAIHKFLELCDFKNTAIDVLKEKERLLNEGKMSEKELDALETTAVEKFFDSEIGNRILNADLVLKEYEFTFFKKAGELYNNINPLIKDEEIVIQGKLDCAFTEGENAVLIDYKSDNITDVSILKSIYEPQLNIYAEALEASTDYKVTEKYIYSFKLKKFVKI